MSFAASPSPELRAAAERFRGFFEELSRAFVERDDLFAQIALALLGREHVLMTGPPGTAKSGIATAVLGRIVDERTGEPSVFARQFTESTVQTDLVGPIDFKTLMQTGRTEHFTDEGMLGAVHAFLDEVLDGRDMLLRTTLNVLQERELKQGTRTTSGRIECALMTTNRYLAEVLESSRDTLLAFVDRIAFVSFVPKGFADEASLGRVLRAQIGGARPRSLKALLTIQDLDVLQAAAERVVVPDEICATLCALLERMDADLGAAAKADPTFLPTRYLSTRTAVRLGRILRAVCVYDAIMRDEPRQLEVMHHDLSMLRLSLLLSGPDHAKLQKLVGRETDPRERRQLSILRTEREIFERALSRLPKTARPVAKPVTTDVARIQKDVEQARGEPKPLLDAAARLAVAADAGGAGAADAAELLATTLARLAERALREGSTAGAGPDARPLDVVPRIAELADGLERASGETRPVARWLRGRAIQILIDAAALAGASVGETLDAALAARGDQIIAQAERALAPLELLLDTCAKLRAAGAEEPAADEAESSMARAVSRVEAELVEIWDAGFREAVSTSLSRAGPGDLGAVLAGVAETLGNIDAYGDRIVKLGGVAGSLKAHVTGPRILPLVRAAFDRAEGTDRLEFIEQVAGLVAELEKNGLGSVIPPDELLRYATTALVRGEQRRPAPPAALGEDGHASYRALRAADQRVSLAYTIVEITLRVSPERRVPTGSASALLGAMGALVSTLPERLRAPIVELDLARVDRAVSHVEAWWARLAAEAEAAASSGDVARMGTALARLAESKFFHVTRDEGALLRFALESRVLGEIFPEADERIAPLRVRIDSIESSSNQVLKTLRGARADAGWTELLGPASTRA